MTRTQLLQEIRQMRCEEAYGGWQARRLTQEEARNGPIGSVDLAFFGRYARFAEYPSVHDSGTSRH